MNVFVLIWESNDIKKLKKKRESVSGSKAGHEHAHLRAERLRQKQFLPYPWRSVACVCRYLFSLVFLFSVLICLKPIIIGGSEDAAAKRCLDRNLCILCAGIWFPLYFVCMYLFSLAFCMQVFVFLGYLCAGIFFPWFFVFFRILGHLWPVTGACS